MPRSTTDDTSTAFTAVDLFCGAGGFSVGLQRAGFDVRLAVDSWQLAVDTYHKNFKHPVLRGDLSAMTGHDLLRHAGAKRGEIDLVVGGPPCQGFSVQRVGPDHDVRNALVLEYARLLAEIAPRLFVMENVPGLIGKRGSELFRAFLGAVDVAGYETEAHVVNAADYGAPQIRKRVVVLGWLRAETGSFPLPPRKYSPDAYVTVDDAIGDLPSPAATEDLKPRDPLHRQTRLSELNRERLRHIPPGGGMENLPVHLRVDCHKAGAEKIGHRYVYGRLAADRPAGTITARFDSFTRGKFAHPLQDRNITLREGARLQTFPDGFGFKGNQEDIACQIGNAVPPVLAEALARAAIEVLKHATPVERSHPRRQPHQAALFRGKVD
jgi:DNA (cytosine-5)-methyltransferase 1